METAPTSSLTSGAWVAGRYRIERLLGAGAMGAVFEATDPQGQACAIKVIHPHIAQAGVNVERFRREVTLVQKVGHPGIVRVLDAGQDPAAGLFLVMELLNGVTLRSPLLQGELTVLQGMEVMTATLDALQAAHAQGIVHRDLKPDNIFLHAPPDVPPQVKLLDFGVARQANAAGITTTNVGLGTPHFMAPEQATDARSVTQASDVWSAGVIMYYMLSGALPFDGDGPYDTVLKACTAQHVPLSQRAPELDHRLVDIVETCLEKDPFERFQDAGELLEVLAPLVHEPTIVAASGARVAAEPRAPDPAWASSAPSWPPPSEDDAPLVVPVEEVIKATARETEGGRRRWPWALAVAVAAAAMVVVQLQPPDVRTESLAVEPPPLALPAVSETAKTEVDDGAAPAVAEPAKAERPAPAVRAPAERRRRMARPSVDRRDAAAPPRKRRPQKQKATAQAEPAPPESAPAAPGPVSPPEPSMAVAPPQPEPTPAPAEAAPEPAAPAASAEVRAPVEAPNRSAAEAVVSASEPPAPPPPATPPDEPDAHTEPDFVTF